MVRRRSEQSGGIAPRSCLVAADYRHASGSQVAGDVEVSGGYVTRYCASRAGMWSRRLSRVLRISG